MDVLLNILSVGGNTVSKTGRLIVVHSIYAIDISGPKISYAFVNEMRILAKEIN